MKTAIICTCLIQHVEGAIKKRPAIATILNKRRDRIGIFKQKKSNYIGFKLDHVISSTNRMNALPPLRLATRRHTSSLTQIQVNLISKGSIWASIWASSTLQGFFISWLQQVMTPCSPPSPSRRLFSNIMILPLHHYLQRNTLQEVTISNWKVMLHQLSQNYVVQ